jgi:hypothetical protein
VFEQYGHAYAKTRADTIVVASQPVEGLEPVTLEEKDVMPELKASKKAPQLFVKQGL